MRRAGTVSAASKCSWRIQIHPPAICLITLHRISKRATETHFQTSIGARPFHHGSLLMTIKDEITWFKQQFASDVVPALAGTPVSFDLVCAIAFQESGELW